MATPLTLARTRTVKSVGTGVPGEAAASVPLEFGIGIAGPLDGGELPPEDTWPETYPKRRKPIKTAVARHTLRRYRAIPLPPWSLGQLISRVEFVRRRTIACAR